MPKPIIHPCEYTIEGNPDGPTLLFIHGWPDDATLWRHQVTALGDLYRCVLVTLPNFGADAVKAGGFDFPRLNKMLGATLSRVLREDERVILITHDFGAYLGYLLERAFPERVEKMVALDIGAHVAPASSREKLFIVGYQWTLIGCWLIGGILPPLGNWLTRKFAIVIKVPPRQASTARSRVNYLYFYMWRGLLLPRWRKSLLRHYTPCCPVLFLYGKSKSVMFHSQRWLSIVEQSGGRSEGIEGAGHWFLESHAEQVNQAILQWLGSTEKL